ncbi:MAG: hypothetical protein KAT00_06320 [Planctomycetes bacterium]|nr:hypothetical protein [Planctomycetota bacterium]MCK5172517.1 hypothetical protein [Planctomycetota bacterium]
MRKAKSERKQGETGQKRAKSRKRVARRKSHKDDPYKKAQEQRIAQHMKRLEDAKNEGLF